MLRSMASQMQTMFQTPSSRPQNNQQHPTSLPNLNIEVQSRYKYSTHRHSNQQSSSPPYNSSIQLKPHRRLSIDQRSDSELSSTSNPENSQQNEEAIIRRDKAFRAVIASSSNKFDGKTLVEYRPWKTSLHREIGELPITSSQWLQLQLSV